MNSTCVRSISGTLWFGMMLFCLDSSQTSLMSSGSGQASMRETPIAGVGIAEVTPSAGFPTGGHGPAGAISRGYWTRLFARAFYVRDSAGRGLMLISVDTFAVSRRLHQDLARSLQGEVEGVKTGIGPESLVVAATHTHHGPGNYLSSALYNVFASPEGGHDRRLERHFHSQLLKAARTAIGTARSNRRVQLLQGALSDAIQLNRSPAVFMLNADRRALLQELDTRAGHIVRCPTPLPTSPESGWDLPECPRLRAVNHRVHLLQISEGERVLGTAVFLAVHPTVLAASAPLFSADIFGIAAREWGRVDAYPEAPVIGLFNGAEGDVVTRRERRDVLDVMRLGRTLADELREIVKHPEQSVPLDEGLIEARARLVNWNRHDSERGPHLALVPFPGAAALGGAEGDRTNMYALGFREGVRRNSEGEHGVKQPALDLAGSPPLLTSVIAPRFTYPQWLPVSVIRYGPLAIVALPFEASTAAGLRIEAAVARSAPTARHILTVGMANEYASYMATADEYEAQDYMGASTLWGPDQSVYFEKVAGDLAGETGSWTRGSGAGFFTGTSARFGPNHVGDHRLVPDATLEQIVRRQDGLPARDLPQFVWSEPYRNEAESLQATTKRRVQILRQDTVVDSDTGYRLLTLQHERPRDGTSTWGAIWLRPLDEVPDGSYYFKVTLEGMATYCSRPFTFQPDVRNVVSKQECPR